MITEDKMVLPKLTKEQLDELNKTFIEDKRIKSLFLSEEDFQGLKDPLYDIKGTKDKNEKLIEAYRNIVDIFKKYVDVNPIYYPLISTWIIGTYVHEHFRSYPFLFFNAMKGSGKTRTLKLTTTLSKDGEMLNSLTEAVLFRTKGTLAIDEFEGIGRKGSENLRELLNSAYKKGAKVKRMKKVKTLGGEEQKVEEFDVYRPIVLANIWGLENVLSDRCISVVLEKSNKKEITRLIELFDVDEVILATKRLLFEFSVVWCSVVTLGNIYREWNEWVTLGTSKYITTGTNNYTKLHSFFKKIDESEIDGRNLELTMPLFIIANEIGEEVFDELIETVKSIVNERKIDDIYNNKDIAVLDYVSQEVPTNDYTSIIDLTRKIKEFIGDTEDWINSKFIGRCLERLKIIIKKKRMSSGIYVLLDYKKAQEKIKMFK